MALIDVADLLTDPDFISPMSVIHRTGTVNNYGENVVADTVTVNTVGSIQPTSGKDLMRLPEALREQNIRTFWVKGVIVTGGAGVQYPDILTFGGKRYQVKAVLDWMNFGQGWSSGVCVAEVPI